MTLNAEEFSPIDISEERLDGSKEILKIQKRLKKTQMNIPSSPVLAFIKTAAGPFPSLVTALTLQV